MTQSAQLTPTIRNNGGNGSPGFGLRAQLFMAERPALVLIGVLVGLILLTGAIEPNFLSQSGMRNTLLQAAPLAILAGAQTILMLTGGIDLSITMIATGSAYVAANQSPNGALIAILMGLTVGLAGRQRQRRGRGRLPGQPADHDAGHVGHICWACSRPGPRRFSRDRPWSRPSSS